MTIYTTGEAGKLVGLSQQSIIRAFDTGKLVGGFKVPGSTFRRIPRRSLVRWAVEYGLPLDEIAPTPEEVAAARAAIAAAAAAPA